MLLDEPKPDQILELERALGRVLLPYVEDEDAAEHLWWDDKDVARDAEGWDPRGSILGWKNRKCYRVNERGEITGLNLWGCGLTEKQTPHLKKLTALEELDLSWSWNGIADGRFLARLDGLRSLALSRNGIADYGFLARLDGLRSLALSRNGIADYGFLARLEGLRSLDLSGNRIADGRFLSRLDGLRSLDLSWNGIADYGFLARLNGLRSLALSRNEIAVGSFLARLDGLRSLDLSWSWNGIADGRFLARLEGLRSLALSGNRIADYGFLARLEGLRSLDLSRNEIADYGFLSRLEGLRSLDLSRNEIADGRFLARLDGLRSLDLSGNRIADARFLSRLDGLRSLDLSGNRIADGRFLTGFNQLTELNLAVNRLENLEPLVELKRLRSLDLGRNRIKQIPRALVDLGLEMEWSEDEFGSFRNGVTLSGNPIESPPAEIVAKGHGAIVAWFESQSGGTRPLNEVKVILVGAGGAGKTSLRKRLMGEGFDEEQTPTDGVDIHDRVRVNDWPVECPDSAGDLQSDLKVHFWDFGGQEIMHATHRFFLSKRSLYVLLLDGRREEDPEYWLRHAETYGGDSPVIVVLNKIDENPSFEVNRSDLREKYPNIAGFFRVSCRDEKHPGVDELRAALVDELVSMLQGLEPWGEAWFAVKDRLEQIDDDFIEFSEYVDVCRRKGVDDEGQRKALVQYLNDLGVIVYFPDLGLKQTQVLNPRWATVGVYKILNAEVLARDRGVLELSDLPAILSRPADSTEDYHYPEEKHGYLVDLMRKFELCYDLERNDDGGERVLVPDLLGFETPEYDFPKSNLLRFRFEYEFLPRSVLPRLMVRLHDSIKDELRWRTGVVFRNEDLRTEARVRVDYNDLTLSVEVTGDRRREHFAVIRDTLGSIHKTFKRFDVTEWVPLPDFPDEAVEYRELVGLERLGETNYTSGKLGKKFPVATLLNGIETEAQRRKRREEDYDSYRGRGSVTVINIEGNTFNGPTAIGDKIKNCFNTSELIANDDLAGAMKELSKQVLSLADELSKTDRAAAEELADDLERLTKEAGSEAPKRKWWSLSLDGIQEAAKKVRGASAPILDTAKRVAALLAAMSA